MIKRFIHIVLLSCLVMCAVFPGFAQKTASGQPNIVESIIASSDSTITIDIPDALLKELLPGTQAPARKLKRNVERQRRPGIVSGYRIQIFADGRNQTTLQARARARANAVLSRFPEFRHQVYSFSKAPTWYTRVGNFATREEAQAALAKLRRAFPSFSREIRIVKSDVVVNH